MDLQPLAFASSDAAAHDGILIGPCMHHRKTCKCLLWSFGRLVVWSFGRLVSLLRPHRINLLLAISQHLQHLWTSNHLHSLPLMQLHTMAYCYRLLANPLSDAIQMLVLVLLVHCWNHVGSMLGHISTFTAPMDLQPPSFASSDAAAHDGILIWPSWQCTI